MEHPLGLPQQFLAPTYRLLKLVYNVQYLVEGVLTIGE